MSTAADAVPARREAHAPAEARGLARDGYLWHEFGDAHLILPC